jgi:hypothetical protein
LSLFLVTGCKSAPAPSEGATDAAPRASAASSAPSASPTPSASAAPATSACGEGAACSAQCPCGNHATCNGGKCEREAGWKVEELALGGGTFGCARYTNGQVWCAGQNAMAQLGRGTRAPDGTVGYEAPAQVTGVTDAVRVAAGVSSACALVKDGHVWCWGLGGNGETGSGAFDVSPTAKAIDGLTDATGLGVGGSHACAIRRGGTVVCWGFNARGQIGDETTENRAKPTPVKGVTGATALALGLQHSCAGTTGNGVMCWGARGGPMGVAVHVTDFARDDAFGASQSDTCVGRGAVNCFGPGFHTLPKPVAGFADATQIAGNNGVLCALRKGGRVTCGDWTKSVDGKVADRRADARLVAVGGSWECTVGKSERVVCNDAHPAKAVLEQL